MQFQFQSALKQLPMLLIVTGTLSAVFVRPLWHHTVAEILSRKRRQLWRSGTDLDFSQHSTAPLKAATGAFLSAITWSLTYTLGYAIQIPSCIHYIRHLIMQKMQERGVLSKI